MEKLQKALRKARSTRDNTAPAPVTRASMSAAERAPTAHENDLEAAWKALRPLPMSRSRLVEHRIMTVDHHKDAVPFDILRTRTAQNMRSKGWRRLAITSPTPGCGKSTVSLNLAFSFARQPDMRLVLFEMDLRRPSLAKILDFKPDVGVDAVLSGQTSFAEQAVSFNNNVAFSLAQRPVQEASELLQSISIGDILNDIEKRYAPDLMIFDMPPMFSNDDVMAFAPNIDCALIVAGAEHTTVKQVDACEQELASQTNILGVVLNKCNYMDEQEAYYSYGT